MSALEDIAKTTDIDRAARVMADAANRLRRLESDGQLTFNALLDAQDIASQAGVTFDVSMGAGLAAWLSEYKQRAGRDEARRIAAAELGKVTP